MRICFEGIRIHPGNRAPIAPLCRPSGRRLRSRHAAPPLILLSHGRATLQRSGGSAFGSMARGGGEERGGEFFVEGEEEFDALAVGGKGFRAVAAIHGTIQFGVGLDQGGRHRQWVVEIGQLGVGKPFAHFQDGPGGFLDGIFLLDGWLSGPRKIVIDESGGTAIAGLQSPADLMHPGHVHGG